MAEQPIGVFDSGVGGLSVLRHIRARLPNEHLVYVADQAHVPYGSRSLDEILRLSEAVTHFLLSYEAKLIVVACNTASGAALTQLRQRFPNVPFVGMEPAVKPAAFQTRSGKVGVLATASTFESRRYSSLMARFAQGVEVFEDPCRGLVDRIEAGEIDTPETARLLQQFLKPMLAAGVDTFVLGCTHYPFVLPLIEAIVGEAAVIIDPAPAVARQTESVLQHNDLRVTSNSAGSVNTYTTGDPHKFAAIAARLLDAPLRVKKAYWQGSRIIVSRGVG